MSKRNPNPYRENILWVLLAIIAGLVTEGAVIVMGRTVPLRRISKKYIFLYKYCKNYIF